MLIRHLPSAGSGLMLSKDEGSLGVGNSYVIDTFTLPGRWPRRLGLLPSSQNALWGYRKESELVPVGCFVLFRGQIFTKRCLRPTQDTKKCGKF